MTESIQSVEPDNPLVARLMGTSSRATWIALSVMVVVLVLWLAFTPGGLLGKADAVGYAVCHRITVRSFLYPNGRQLPMCARCSGTFLGVLVGLLGPGVLFRRRRAGMFPAAPIVGVMLALSAFWAFDGANSFTFLLPPGVPHLYEPSNFLRLSSGMFHGITMGSLLLPIANATLWDDVTAEPTISNGWQYLILLAIGGVIMALVLSGGVMLYPLGVLSAIGALSILSTITTVMVTSFLRLDNRPHSLREALPLIFFGVALALVLVSLIDLGRFAMFGTWEGMVFPTDV